MKTKSIFLIILSVGFFIACNSNKQQNDPETAASEKKLIGKWVRISQVGPIAFEFKENGLVEGDFGNDQTIDVIARYELSNDTIKFVDEDGQMCKELGLYKTYQTDYYVSFDLIDDNCSGRIKSIMGFWTRPNFEELIKTLGEEISKQPKSDLFLSRARVYLATGMIKQAKDDFDEFLLTDTLDAPVYVNRAGTKFPIDLNGAIIDCNKAIELDPNNKNAYFLRGLARYELGEKKLGCEDFYRAIELGFSILRIAEQEKCIDFWDKK